VKSDNQDRRRRRRGLIERTPEEIARAHEDALWWRARLRAEVAGEVLAAIAPQPAPVPASAQREAAERARFATAIARAEFGRFYFKGERPARKRKPARNGKGSG
jgi:hypothetical protein